MEPPERLRNAVEEMNLEKDCFVVLGHGETKRYDLVRNGARVIEESMDVTLWKDYYYSISRETQDTISWEDI